MQFELRPDPTLTPARHARLARILNCISAAPASERLSAFETTARRVYGEMVGPDYSIADASARLQVTAEAYGLVEDFGDDRIQTILENAVANPIALQRSELGGDGIVEPGAAGPHSPIIPATFIMPSAWPNEAPEPIDWLVDELIPRGDVTILTGDGGLGKTDIGLQLAANCARAAPYWLGRAITAGPTVVISAEELEREIRRRLRLHGQRDGYDYSDLGGRLHLWFSDQTANTIMAIADRSSGVMVPTQLFRSIEAGIAKIAPIVVMVDNVAATFGGSQNDRVSARSYVNLWRAIARQPSKPAVILFDHPSLSGLSSGTGRGGNVDWRNAVRSALHLRAPDDAAEAKQGVRILELMKSNYARPGTIIRLHWVAGGLNLEPSTGSPHRVAKDAECQETFLWLLDERNAQGRSVSASPSTTYAPHVFAEEMAGNGGFTTKAFSQAMNRLFTDRRIKLEESGPPSKRRSYIVRSVGKDAR